MWNPLGRRRMMKFVPWKEMIGGEQVMR